MDDDYESVLLVIRECYVYKLPPRVASSGYRAQDWGDATAFMWKGRLRIISKGQKCFIRLEDANTGEIFAVCPYHPDSNSVEPVLDSSRFFVLKVEEQGRHAFLGMGFPERSEAFDFNVTLQDWVKQSRAGKGSEVDEAPVLPTGPKKDYSLKEGETINISIGGLGSRERRKPKAVNANSGPVPFLPPPPSAADVRRSNQQNKKV